MTDPIDTLREETAAEALETFGIGHQLIIAQRECTEVIDAICKMAASRRERMRRGQVFDMTPAEKLAIVREFSDIALMAKQAELWAGTEMWAEATKRSAERCMVHVETERAIVEGRHWS